MPGTPRQTFRIDEYIWKKFQKKCESKGFTASDVLRAFIQRVLEGAISIDSVKPARAKRGEQLTDFYSQFEKWLREHP